MDSHRLLAGKVALITGASRGIGRAIAEKFANEGAIVYANSLPGDNIDDWASEYTKKCGTKVIPAYFDITDASAARNSILSIKKDMDRIDILVNNAGLGYNELIGMISMEKLRSVFEVNVFALINIMQITARIMTKQQSGSIINISSTVGMKGNPGQLAYSASKGAVISASLSAAKELAKNKIRVNSVAPGLVDTEMFRLAESKNLEDRISRIGMGRLANPEEIANACVFLGSDLSEYVTGQVLAVDGSAII
jgi:3-oxoacyl-[acyl-carrier protein] reductase